MPVWSSRAIRFCKLDSGKLPNLCHLSCCTESMSEVGVQYKASLWSPFRNSNGDLGIMSTGLPKKANQISPRAFII